VLITTWFYFQPRINVIAGGAFLSILALLRLLQLNRYKKRFSLKDYRLEYREQWELGGTDIKLSLRQKSALFISCVVKYFLPYEEGWRRIMHKLFRWPIIAILIVSMLPNNLLVKYIPPSGIKDIRSIVVTASILLLLFGIGIWLALKVFHIRKGRYSSETFRERWLEMFAGCPLMFGGRMFLSKDKQIAPKGSYQCLVCGQPQIANNHGDLSFCGHCKNENGQNNVFKFCQVA